MCPPNPTTHHTITPSYLFFGRLTPCLFFFPSSSLICSSLLSSSPPTLPHHHHHHLFHYHFLARSPENCCEPINTFTSFFEVKISYLFGGFYTFAWGYFYLSFNDDTMWFMSIRSDIYLFVYMGFVLVELFDEWVYGLY